LLVFVVGCGSDDKSSDSGDSGATAAQTTAAAGDSGAPAWLTAAQDAAKKATAFPDKIQSAQLGSFTPKPSATIYHVACNLALGGCARFSAALKAGSEALGYKFKVCNGGTSADTIAKCFTNAVNAKPDVIVANGIGADIAGDGYAAAKKAGIPILGSLTGNTPGAVPGVATEVNGATCEAEGNDLANWVIADSAGKANILFAGTKTYACNQQRQAGFLSTIKACETCKVTTLEYAIDAIQSALPQQLQSALQSNADATYVVATPDAAALAAVDAVRQSGKQIKVAGFDGDAPNVALVKKGDIDAAEVTTGFAEDGWTAADAAARVIAGEKVPNVVSGTRIVLDKSNVDQVDEQYEGVTGYPDQFKALWK